MTYVPNKYPTSRGKHDFQKREFGGGTTRGLGRKRKLTEITTTQIALDGVSLIAAVLPTDMQYPHNPENLDASRPEGLMLANVRTNSTFEEIPVM